MSDISSCQITEMYFFSVTATKARVIVSNDRNEHKETTIHIHVYQILFSHHHN